MAKSKSAWYVKPTLVIGIIVLVLCAGYIFLPQFFRFTYSITSVKKVLSETEISKDAKPAEPPVTHQKTPSPVKGIYMTSCAAGTPSYRDRLIKLIDTTELNSVVIDVKDFSGTISFVPHDPTLLPYAISHCQVKDMKELIEMLHQKNIYVIGRITTFQDPLFTKLHPETAVRTQSDGKVWKDRKGISYIDPSSKEAWDHVVLIAKESYAIGFDEINFDYIRFPSDGNMSDIAFPWTKQIRKQIALETFFKYLHSALEKTGIVTSADLFGMTTTAEDDMGIGQVLEAGLPYFDFIMPMVYPSHYPPTFNSWANPNAHPYDLIKFVMGTAVERTRSETTRIKTLDGQLVASTSPQLYTKKVYNIQKLRPWLQDFSLGQPSYTATEVRAQIKATYDVGLTSWILWDASNKYSTGALEPQP